jgi:hypothetical protein
MQRTRVLSARYTMLADFYRQSIRQTESGQVIRRWDREDPYIIQNLTEGILGGGIRVVGSTETWGSDYNPIEWAKMYISDQVVDDDERGPVTLNRRFRVSNIRDRVTGQPLWVDDDRKNIEFHVMGITPIQDPFGRNVEYEILLKGVVDDQRNP